MKRTTWAALLAPLPLAVAAGAAIPAGRQLWRFYPDFAVASLAAIPDLSAPANGGQDILVGASDDSLYLVEARGAGSGAQLWSAGFKSDVNTVAALPDLNGDGRPDVAAGDAFGLVMALSGGSGHKFWAFIASGGILSVAGLPEGDVVAGSENDTVYCLKGTLPGMTGTGPTLLGQVEWKFATVTATVPGKKVAAGGPPPGAGRPGSRPQGANSVAAIRHGSATYGVAVGASSDQVFCLSPAASKSAAGQPDLLWSFAAAGDVWQVVPFPDVDGDGVEEVLAASGDDHAYLISGKDGTLLWSFQVQAGSGANAVAVLGDANGDGAPDALVGDGDGHVYCVSGKAGAGKAGVQLWSHDFGDSSTVEALAGSPDLNGDGHPDAIVGTSNDALAVLAGGQVFWSQALGGTVVAVASLADVDSNGFPDVVGGTLAGFAAAYEGGGDGVEGLRARTRGLNASMSRPLAPVPAWSWKGRAVDSRGRALAPGGF